MKTLQEYIPGQIYRPKLKFYPEELLKIQTTGRGGYRARAVYTVEKMKS